MSCHNPETQTKNGAGGFAVWARLPEIMQENRNVRFAILAGDQIYADEVERPVKNEQNLQKWQELYLSIYKKFWDNIFYRRILCSLPAYLMWDDHDITDGWGSREDSFKKKPPTEFQEEWLRLFEAARSVFKQMQALRNPGPPIPGYSAGFDYCFKVGRAAFVVPDLRSNRNVRLPRIMLPEQLNAISKWIEDNRKDEANKNALDVLFFVSTVVFSHDAPQITGFILQIWLLVLDVAKWLGKFRIFKGLVGCFDRKVGDLRDDINDSWGAKKNSAAAEGVLDFLFDLQNPPDPKDAIDVVILSGGIHTPGYSTIYSAVPTHQEKAVIPHIVASPVAYQALNWTGEAIFRHFTKAVPLGTQGHYYAQISHHFCYRNVVIVSYRTFPGVNERETHLKVKYYLEDFPGPQIMLFDLNRSSHRENIRWDMQPLP